MSSVLLKRRAQVIWIDRRMLGLPLPFTRLQVNGVREELSLKVKQPHHITSPPFGDRLWPMKNPAASDAR